MAEVGRDAVRVWQCSGWGGRRSAAEHKCAPSRSLELPQKLGDKESSYCSLGLSTVPMIQVTGGSVLGQSGTRSGHELIAPTSIPSDLKPWHKFFLLPPGMRPWTLLHLRPMHSKTPNSSLNLEASHLFGLPEFCVCVLLLQNSVVYFTGISQKLTTY